MTQLDITGWGFLSVFGFLTVLAWFLVVRWHRNGRFGAALAGALLLTLLLSADAVNSYFSDLPHVADVVSAVTGRASWKETGSG